MINEVAGFVKVPAVGKGGPEGTGDKSSWELLEVERSNVSGLDLSIALHTLSRSYEQYYSNS